MKPRKSWREKIADDAGVAEIRPIPPRMRKKAGCGTIVIPALREVDEIIREIPRGKVATVQHLSGALAKRHRATIGCTVTTGIFARMVANAAQEDLEAGHKKVAPYWRVLKDGGELNQKYPGGIAELRDRLKAEGHSIVADRRRFLVDRYQDRLARI